MIEKNLQILSLKDQNWIASFKQVNHSRQFVMQEERKKYFIDEHEKIYVTEDKFLKDEINSLKKEIIFVFGIVNITEIRSLYLKKNKDTIIVVIEPNLSLLKHALNYLDLSIFRKKNLFLFADHKVENLSIYLAERMITALEFIVKIKNIQFYFTDYYRKYDVDVLKEFMHCISETITTKISLYGNSIEDNLIGLKRNLSNMPYLRKSKNVTKLSTRFKDIPAIVVAAGPSLNKNIQHIKKAKGKAIIIAVDTILSKLLQEGIVPHFVCSIEREIETYNYFYKDKKIPDEVYVVGPPVLYSAIFEENKHHAIIPLRNGVKEAEWLRGLLNLHTEDGFDMGISCAHVAFGLASHLGCSPIILTGQDLAYGDNDDESHAIGTIYDNGTIKVKKENKTTKGYDGGIVQTTSVWLQFKLWFEQRIRMDNLTVINATEGGACINFTKQMPLIDTIDQFCQNTIEDISEELLTIPNNDLTIETLEKNFKDELDHFKRFTEDSLKYLVDLKIITINAEGMMENQQKYLKQLSYMEKVIPMISGHPLLMHNLQAELIQYFWKVNSMDDIISVETLNNKKDAQIYFLNVIIAVMTTIIEEMENTLRKIDEEDDE